MKTITKLMLSVALLSFSFGAFSQPTVAPTAPISRPVSSVISIYGTDTYTPITGANPLADWGQGAQGSTFTIYTIAGTSHNVLKYGKLSYQGIDFTGNAQDVSGMKYLHLDIWTADAAASPLSVAIINGNSNIAVSKTITTTGTWYSLDILLSEFTGQNLTAINQLMFKSTEWSTFATNLLQKDIYVDNIYFWTDVIATLAVSTTSVSIAQPANSTGSFNVTSTQNWTASSDQSWLTVSPTSGTLAGATVTLTATANTASANRTATVTVTGTDATVKTVTVTQAGLPIPASPTPTVAAANVKSIYSDAYTPAVTNFVYLTQQWWNSTWSAVTLADGGNALKLVATTSGGGGGGIQFDALTITGMTNLHFDIYPNADAAGATMKYTVTPAGAWIVLPTPSNYSSLTANAWNSFDIPVSSLASGASTLPVQIGFGTFSGPGTFYVDNVLFYSGTYTTFTGISTVIADNGIKCYPSMAQNSLNVSANNEISEISIVSLVGQSLRTVTVNSNSKTITLNDLVSGQYLVRIKLANGQIGTQRFIKL